jgi:hypothetical protein
MTAAHFGRLPGNVELATEALHSIGRDPADPSRGWGGEPCSGGRQKHRQVLAYTPDDILIGLYSPSFILIV